MTVQFGVSYFVANEHLTPRKRACLQNRFHSHLHRGTIALAPGARELTIRTPDHPGTYGDEDVFIQRVLKEEMKVPFEKDETAYWEAGLAPSVVRSLGLNRRRG